MATQHDKVGFWSQAGGSLRLESKGSWWAESDRKEWPDDPEARAWIESRWAEPWGDRRQELVIIGMELSEESVTSFLDASLLSDEEMLLGPEAWMSFADPFPAWCHSTQPTHSPTLALSGVQEG